MLARLPGGCDLPAGLLQLALCTVCPLSTIAICQARLIASPHNYLSRKILSRYFSLQESCFHGVQNLRVVRREIILMIITVG
jgi:hypothetical protein